MQFFHLPVCYQEKMHIFSTNTERKWKRQQRAAVNLQLHNKIMLKTNFMISFIFFLFEKSLLYCCKHHIAIKWGEICSVIFFFPFLCDYKFCRNQYDSLFNMSFLKCLHRFRFRNLVFLSLNSNPMNFKLVHFWIFNLLKFLNFV